MTLPFRFLFDNAEAEEYARARVEQDACQFQLSRKYRLYYKLLRPIMPIRIRQLLQRCRIAETNDDWYMPFEFVQAMARFLSDAKRDQTTIHPWPHGKDFGFVLTHDVETADGMRHIGRIADFEQELGFRSSWNLVPYKYPIDMGLVRDLTARGFEIGIHGYNHDGRLFSSRRTFDRRAVNINRAIEKYNAVGFRAPMVHRNLEWLQSLEIEYDASCFDIDPYQATPGGVGSIWPFIAGRFVELPYTMPQDHTLFVGLGQQDDRVWQEKLDFIVRHQGMALMLTHPDYLTSPSQAEIYFRFLESVKQRGGYWHANPKAVARWWREREQKIEFREVEPRDSGLDHSNDSRFAVSKLELKQDDLQFVLSNP